MVLFSGILSLAVEEKAPSIFYQDIPHYPFHHTAGPGHEGKLYFGKQGNRDVIVFSGRAHCYQGYSLAQVCIQTPTAADIIVKSTFSIKTAFPVRLMKLLGVKQIIITNVAGAINSQYEVGSYFYNKQY